MEQGVSTVGSLPETELEGFKNLDKKEPPFIYRKMYGADISIHIPTVLVSVADEKYYTPTKKHKRWYLLLYSSG